MPEIFWHGVFIGAVAGSFYSLTASWVYACVREECPRVPRWMALFACATWPPWIVAAAFSNVWDWLMDRDSKGNQ